MKIYSIEFHVDALKEWQKLDRPIQLQFKKQLEKRLSSPHVASAQLHAELSNFYKIKLRAIGYRLVYEVVDEKLIILIIAVGRRDHDKVYAKATRRK